MKKISLFFIALFSGVIFAFGSGKPAMNVIPMNADRFMVAMENETPSPMVSVSALPLQKVSYSP